MDTTRQNFHISHYNIVVRSFDRIVNEEGLWEFSYFSCRQKGAFGVLSTGFTIKVELPALPGAIMRLRFNHASTWATVAHLHLTHDLNERRTKAIAPFCSRNFTQAASSQRILSTLMFMQFRTFEWRWENMSVLSLLSHLKVILAFRSKCHQTIYLNFPVLFFFPFMFLFDLFEINLLH